MELLVISGEKTADWERSQRVEEILQNMGHTTHFVVGEDALATDEGLSYDAVVTGIGRPAALSVESAYSCAGLGFNVGHLSGCRVEGTRFESEQWARSAAGEPPQGPFAVARYPDAQPCGRGVANVVRVDDLWGFGPVGVLGHVLSYKVTRHETCR